MEENKVAQITKHTDSSRITDSGVSGNAQTGARETRKIAEAAAKELFTDKYFRETALASNNHDDHAHAQEIAAAVIEKACSRLASRVEELKNLIATHSGSLNSADSASNTESSSTAKETR